MFFENLDEKEIPRGGKDALGLIFKEMMREMIRKDLREVQNQKTIRELEMRLADVKELEEILEYERRKHALLNPLQLVQG